MQTGTTREKIIGLAREIMQQIGYHSFAYKQIAEQIGIKNSSIHHYFPSKVDLGLAVIEKDRGEFEALIRKLAGSSPKEKVEALLDAYTETFKNDRKLCILGTFGMAYNDVDKKIQEATRSYLDLIIQWLSVTFKEGLRTGEFSFNRSPQQVAADWAAALPGSLAIGRMQGEVYFKQIINSLRKSLQG